MSEDKKRRKRRRFLQIAALLLLALTVLLFFVFGPDMLYSKKAGLRVVGRKCLYARIHLGCASPAFLADMAIVADKNSVSPERDKTVGLIRDGVSALSDQNKAEFLRHIEQALLSSTSKDHSFGLVYDWGEEISYETACKAFVDDNPAVRLGGYLIVFGLKEEEFSPDQKKRLIENLFAKGLSRNDSEMIIDALSCLSIRRNLKSFVKEYREDIQSLTESKDARVRKMAIIVLAKAKRPVPPEKSIRREMRRHLEGEFTP